MPVAPDSPNPPFSPAFGIRHSAFSIQHSTFNTQHSTLSPLTMPSLTDPPDARPLDASDPLASFRDRFVISDPDLIYLDGNSLGRLPKASVDLARDVIELQWGDRLIRSWGEGWLEAPSRIGAKIAQLIGAQPRRGRRCRFNVGEPLQACGRGVARAVRSSSGRDR